MTNAQAQPSAPRQPWSGSPVGHVDLANSVSSEVGAPAPGGL